jgi:hypothetical protein
MLGMSRLHVEPARDRLTKRVGERSLERSLFVLFSVESASSVAPFPEVAWAFLSRLTPQML